MSAIEVKIGKLAFTLDSGKTLEGGAHVRTGSETVLFEAITESVKLGVTAAKSKKEETKSRRALARSVFSVVQCYSDAKGRPIFSQKNVPAECSAIIDAIYIAAVPALPDNATTTAKMDRDELLKDLRNSVKTEIWRDLSEAAFVDWAISEAKLTPEETAKVMIERTTQGTDRPAKHNAGAFPAGLAKLVKTEWKRAFDRPLPENLGGAKRNAGTTSRDDTPKPATDITQIPTRIAEGKLGTLAAAEATHSLIVALWMATREGKVTTGTERGKVTSLSQTDSAILHLIGRAVANDLTATEREKGDALAGMKAKPKRNGVKVTAPKVPATA